MSRDRQRPCHISSFVSDERGTVLVSLVIGTVIMLAAMALAFDLGRLFTLNSELQNHADAAALAGAAELDGALGARARATLAAQTGLQGSLRNIQTFANDGEGREVDVAVGGIQFLRRLPPDSQEVTTDDLATTDADARFIRVVAEERTVANTLSQPLRGITPWNTNAAAIAGFTQAVCRFPPLFMCNPLESASFPVPSQECADLLGSGAPFDPNCLPKGVQVLLKFVGGQDSFWSPGNFGLLDPPSGNQGSMNVAEQIASARPNACFSSFVETRTGESVGPIKSAINVRFDMYENPGFGNKKNDPLYRPAVNVLKGRLPNGSACNTEIATDPTVAMPLPRDACFATDSCAGGNRFGDGNWNRNDYWAVNHPGELAPPNLDVMSRYEVYRYEIDNGGIPNNSPSGENGNPQCYNGGTLTDPSQDPDGVGADEIDRRILVLAVLNCAALQEQGYSLNGNSNVPLPVERFAKVFLTEPSQGQGNDQANVWGEIIGVLDPGDLDGILHDIVQLYR